MALGGVDLYSIWLDNDETIRYAKQKVCPQEETLMLKDIAVDNTITTKTGFHPKVALLTVEGNIYITHLSVGQCIIMYHLANTSCPPTIHSFYHHNGKIMTLRRNGMYDDVTERPDNFEFLYLNSLLKKWYND